MLVMIRGPAGWNCGVNEQDGWLQFSGPNRRSHALIFPRKHEAPKLGVGVLQRYSMIQELIMIFFFQRWIQPAIQNEATKRGYYR